MAAEFSWSDEQAELRRTLRKFLAEVSPETAVRAFMASEPGYDPAVWASLGGDLGVLGLPVPERFGGAGDSHASLVILAEEAGRALLCGPMLGSIALGATVLGLLDDDVPAKADHLPGVVAGRTVATLAAPVRRGAFDAPAVQVVASGSRDAGWTLTGSARHVPDGLAAEVVLVAAQVGSGIGLFAVTADAAGLARESLPTMDLTRRQAALTLEATPAHLVAGPDRAADICARAVDVAAVFLAAEQVGAAQHLLDLAVEHAKVRFQFGRPLGSFQAVKHHLANMLVAVEQARSTAYHAAWALDGAVDDPRLAASLALSTCSDACGFVARKTIQVLGGIGFTWEHPTHLYFKRIVTNAALLGSANDHRDRLAALVLDQEAAPAGAVTDTADNDGGVTVVTTDDPERARVAAAARAVLDKHDPTTAPREELLGAIYDAGLAWVRFPVGLGGLGLPGGLQTVADEILQSAGAPNPLRLNPMGYGMAGPTLIEHGSPELKARLLRPLYTAEEMWCQLFSEPGAGSDLAGLATRAVREGDEWVVDGQKVWTSLAHRARWALLLARTDPDAPKHRGLTYFVLDMRDPGVEVRPLRQLTGQAEFNEVFLRGARIPDSHRLGEVGAGWRVAMTTLMNERSALGGAPPLRGSGVIGEALALWRDRPDLRTPALRLRLADLWAQAEAYRLTAARARAARRIGPPGPEDSIGKLVGAELNQTVLDFCLEFLGPEGTLIGTYDLDRDVPPDPATDAYRVQRMALRARANTIEGGTSEVMRNILGERVLGLPGDLRADSGKAWKDIPRG